MDSIAPKRPRRSGKITLKRSDPEQDRSESDLDLRIGQISEIGSGTPEQAPAEVESWPAFVVRMNDLYQTNKKLRIIWHPNPAHHELVTANITLVVRQGDPKGQLSDGSYIEI